MLQSGKTCLSINVRQKNPIIKSCCGKYCARLLGNSTEDKQQLVTLDKGKSYFPRHFYLEEANDGKQSAKACGDDEQQQPEIEQLAQLDPEAV